MVIMIKPWKLQNIDTVLEDVKVLLEKELDPIEEYMIIRLQYLLLKYRKMIEEKAEEKRIDFEEIMSKGKAVIYIDDFRSIKDIDPRLIRRGSFKLYVPIGRSHVAFEGAKIEETMTYNSTYLVFDNIEDTEYGILPVFRRG